MVAVVLDGALLENCGRVLERDCFSWPCGFGKENALLEVPTLVFGGGPAGVVELAKMEVVGLLVGVVEAGFWAMLLKREPPAWP